MYPNVYISSYVKGPVNTVKQGPRPNHHLAFRISDVEICADIRQSFHGNCHRDRTFYQLEAVDPAELKTGDLVLVESGQMVHADGVIRKGAALIDESVVTGDS